MKKTRFLQFLSAFLLTVIMTSEVDAQLASRGDAVSATNINLAIGDSNSHGFVLESLVSEQHMREALRQKVSEAYEHLQQVGQTQAALQLFSVVGGVLAGYEHEAPDVVSVLADVPAEGVDVPMLQQSLSALCNAKNRQGELLWIDLKVCTYAALKPVKKNPLLARLVLLPGRSLWKAPGFAAEKMDDLTGPMFLYQYAERGNSYECGLRPAPSDAAFIAFVRKQDAVEWPASTWRLVYRGDEDLSTVTLTDWLIMEPEKQLVNRGKVFLSTGAEYVITGSSKLTSQSIIRIGAIPVIDMHTLTAHPDMPFIFLQKEPSL